MIIKDAAINAMREIDKILVIYETKGYSSFLHREDYVCAEEIARLKLMLHDLKNSVVVAQHNAEHDNGNPVYPKDIDSFLEEHFALIKEIEQRKND